MGFFGDQKKHDRYVGYVSKMSHIDDSNPSFFEEDAEQKVWKDPMTQEYQSILKNDVWYIDLTFEGKYIFTSR